MSFIEQQCQEVFCHQSYFDLVYERRVEILLLSESIINIEYDVVVFVFFFSFNLLLPLSQENKVLLNSWFLEKQQ